MINSYKNFNNKKIIITGHSGFKGSWLTIWLLRYGAKIVGISKDIPTNPSHYVSLNINQKIKEYFIKLEDEKKLKKIIQKEQPDFIFHLAAQAIVKRSYLNPLETWKSNTFGTLSLLESLRVIKKKVYVIIVTSDKAYKNLELDRGYKESDILGGDDPYSASKGAVEILTNSYIKSFFKKKTSNVSVAIARAGNVIGGGDWSNFRLIPDCVKSWSKNKKVLIRNPKSTRPWQHVMEVLSGYLTLAVLLQRNNKLHGEAFNFGPSLKNKLNVINVVKKMKFYWEKVEWKILKQKKTFHESKLLQLNSKKSKDKLNWNCVLDADKTIQLVSEWYKSYYSTKRKKHILTLKQIEYYENILKENRKI